MPVACFFMLWACMYAFKHTLRRKDSRAGSGPQRSAETVALRLKIVTIVTNTIEVARQDCAGDGWHDTWAGPSLPEHSEQL